MVEMYVSAYTDDRCGSVRCNIIRRREITDGLIVLAPPVLICEAFSSDGQTRN